MTDVQMFTLGLAISTSFLAVLIGVLLNNNRLNDVKDLITAKVESSRGAASLGMAEMRTLIEKNHSEMMVRLSDIEGRLGRLEGERRIV